jgi:L-amino acid N-acyltransferase YncA
MLSLRSILRLGARLGSCRRKLILECTTADAFAAVAAVPVTFRYGRAADLETLAAPEYAYDAAARAFGLERLRAGDRLVLCESAGRIVFYAWVMFGQMDMGLREYASLSPARAYTYKLFTLPDSRGQRICPAYYTFIKRELRALGYRSLVAWVEAGNRASIRAHKRAGFRVVGCIWHIRFLFRSYPLLRPALRRNLAHGLVPSLA